MFCTFLRIAIFALRYVRYFYLFFLYFTMASYMRFSCHSTDFLLVLQTAVNHPSKVISTRKNYSQISQMYLTQTSTSHLISIIIIHRHHNGNKQNAVKIGVRKHLCYCSLLGLRIYAADRGTASQGRKAY